MITEFSASYWGYTGQIQRPIFVGAEPTPAWRRLFDVAFEAYERITAALAPGATEAETIRAGSVIAEAGYAIYDDLVHGYGVDIMPPIVDRACTQGGRGTTRDAARGRTFEEGMAVVIQPNPITPDERMGLQLGELNVVRPNGAESLHGVSFKPLIAALNPVGLARRDGDVGGPARRGAPDALAPPRLVLQPGRGAARRVRGRRFGSRRRRASRRRSRTASRRCSS